MPFEGFPFEWQVSLQLVATPVANTNWKPQKAGHSEKPYVCRFGNCLKSFYHEGHLRRHQRMKHGLQRVPHRSKSHLGKLFVCGMGGCEARFFHQCDLKRHWKNKHNIRAPDAAVQANPEQTWELTCNTEMGECLFFAMVGSSQASGTIVWKEVQIRKLKLYCTGHHRDHTKEMFGAGKNTNLCCWLGGSFHSDHGNTNSIWSWRRTPLPLFWLRISSIQCLISSYS